MSIEYIHYGDKKFNKKKFEEIKNIMFVKPLGGLWASRVDSEYGWKSWCESQNFHPEKYRENNYFKFKLRENAKVLTIANREQLEKIIKQNLSEDYKALFVALNFEELAKQYDAIEVLISEDNRLYWDLYGWDCDSILVMNKDVIEEV